MGRFDTCHSIIGCCMILGKSLISGKCKKQDLVFSHAQRLNIVQCWLLASGLYASWFGHRSGDATCWAYTNSVYITSIVQITSNPPFFIFHKEKLISIRLRKIGRQGDHIPTSQILNVTWTCNLQLINWCSNQLN